MKKTLIYKYIEINNFDLKCFTLFMNISHEVYNENTFSSKEVELF